VVALTLNASIKEGVRALNKFNCMNSKKKNKEAVKQTNQGWKRSKRDAVECIKTPH
jgi:hypothetical protein